MKKKLLVLMLTAMMIFSLAACGSDSSSDDASTSETSESADTDSAADTEEEGLGTTAEYDNCILEITGAYADTTEEGEAVLKITATYTNNNEDPLYAYCSFAVKAFQDNVEISDMSLNAEDNDLTTEVKDGASIDVTYTFLLNDESAAAEFYVCSPTADEVELAELIYEP